MGMKKIDTFEQFLKERKNFYSALGSVDRQLYSLGINLITAGDGIGFELNWHKMPEIVEKVEQLDFFDELTKSECIALAIAVSEELANGFCHDCDIALVNRFFGININRETIRKMNTQFI